VIGKDRDLLNKIIVKEKEKLTVRDFQIAIISFKKESNGVITPLTG